MKQVPTCLPSTNLDFDEAPTSRALTLSSQGTNLVFRSSYSKDTNPYFLGLIENVNSDYSNVLDILITILFLQKFLFEFTVHFSSLLGFNIFISTVVFIVQKIFTSLFIYYLTFHVSNSSLFKSSILHKFFTIQRL